MVANVDVLLREFDELKEQRSLWMSNWQEIAELVLPKRADFLTKRSAGETRTERLVDSTALIANELLASGLNGMLTNPASKWFTLRTRDPDLMDKRDVAVWIEEVTRRMLVVFAAPENKFAPAIHEYYLDMGAFGTATLSAMESKEGEIVFQTHHLETVYASEGVDGLIDKVFVAKDWTIRAMVARWGLEGISKKSREKFSMAPEHKVEVVHAVFPRDVGRDVTSLLPEDMPIASIWFEKGEKTLLEDGGFEEQRIFVGRWMKVAGENYGRSPGWSTLPDNKMLQAMVRTTIRAAQKAADPPVLAPDEGYILPILTTPSGINYGGIDATTGQERLKYLESKGNFAVSFEMIERTRDMIRSGFHVDQLMTPSNKPMTATEVLERTQEKLRLLAPTLGRQQTETLGPLINTVFAMMLRQDKFPPVPLPLQQGEQIDIEYVSPIARQQRVEDLLAIQRTLELVGAVVPVAPEVVDNFDIDVMIREAADINGLPASILRDPKRRDAIRAQRAQAQAAQAAQDQASQEAETAGKAAPLLRAVQ